MATSIKFSYNSEVKIAEMSQFAMRLIVIFSFILLSLSGTAQAQDSAAALYEVGGVAIDVTAKSAAQARDTALIQAQHQAFAELMGRLNVSDKFTQTMSDDDIATLVQSFEVQNERASSVRYIGLYNVRFKPNAVRTLLTKNHLTYNEEHGTPLVILPVYSGEGKPMLWEESTAWRTAWDTTPPNSGVVPVIVPAGALDDVSALTAAEAVDGKTTSLKNIIDKYKASGAVVMNLTTKLDAATTSPLTLILRRFDTNGNAGTPATLTIPAPTTKATIPQVMAQAVKKARNALDKEWHDNPHDFVVPTEPAQDVSLQNQIPAAGTNTMSPPIVDPTTNTTMLDSDPTAHITVAVTIANLADWSMIKRRIESVQDVVHISILAMQRGAVEIDLEYRGSTPNLQQNLRRAELYLDVDPVEQTWLLKKGTASPL